MHLGSSWHDILRVVIATVMVFLAVVAILRVVGAQAIAKMSAYDMVSMVTLGSITATVAISKDVSIAQGIAALITLIVLQETMRFLQSRYLKLHHLIRQSPVVVLWEGRLLEDRLTENRISADEVRAAIRRQGMSSFSEARIVVLENDGDWSVVPIQQRVGDDSALLGLAIPGRPENSRGKDNDKAVAASPRKIP